MGVDIGRIEARLGQDVHRYLRGANPEVEAALSSDLEYLLTGLWEASGVTPGRWFDGLVEAIFKIRKRRRVEVRGLMYWGTLGKDARQWVDVFAAHLCLVVGGDELEGYTLRFGRRGLEERRVLFGEHRDLRQELKQPRDWEWAFVFRKPEDGR